MDDPPERVAAVDDRARAAHDLDVLDDERVEVGRRRSGATLGRDTAVVETSYLRDLLPYTSPDWDSVPEDLQDRLGQLRVSDAMTEGLESLPPDASVAEVAQTLRKNGLHHVFVVERGMLRGVVSTYDLLQLVEHWKES